MQQETPELVDLALVGDQQAMVQLVDRFRNRVFGLCLRMLGQRQDAEDAAQETFIRMLRSLARWDSSREFEPWLLAIAANRCRTVLAHRHRRLPQAMLHEELLEDRSPNWQDAEQLEEEVSRALEQIRAEDRQAFLLFHEQGLAYAQIASLLGRPVGTVKTWIHRARRELVARLVEREVVTSKPYELRRI